MSPKALYATFAATAMALCSPVQAQTDEIVYKYIYYEDGVEVGEAQDYCYSTGRIDYRVLWWGYATEEYVVLPHYRCVNGEIHPIN